MNSGVLWAGKPARNGFGRAAVAVALDRSSRQVIALFIGDRSANGSLGLWQALPERYRQKATFYSDDWDAYKGIIPKE